MQIANPFDPLPDIPVCADAALAPADQVVQAPETVAAILAEARRTYTTPLLRLGDRLSRSWAESRDLPYLAEMRAVAEAIDGPGGWLLNLSYEWGCTTACLAAPEPRPETEPAPGSGVGPSASAPAPGPQLLHTLDWQLPGLGETIRVIRRPGPAGEWWTFGWPGFVGTVQGVAPGRFAACLNQAPAPASGLGLVGDWVKGRLEVWRSRGCPPALLLRRVFETCASFADACETLASTPVCLPVLFALTGTGASDAVVIERLPDRARLHRLGEKGFLAVTNHWLSADLPGTGRSFATHERLQMIQSFARRRPPTARPVPGAWLKPPILNDLTRTALEADAATGEVWVQGFRQGRPATRARSLRLRPD